MNRVRMVLAPFGSRASGWLGPRQTTSAVGVAVALVASSLSSAPVANALCTPRQWNERPEYCQQVAEQELSTPAPGQTMGVERFVQDVKADPDRPPGTAIELINHGHTVCINLRAGVNRGYRLADVDLLEAYRLMALPGWNFNSASVLVGSAEMFLCPELN